MQAWKGFPGCLPTILELWFEYFCQVVVLQSFAESVVGAVIFGALVLGAAIPAVHAAAVCVPYVEEQPRWSSARLRAHTDDFADCVIDEAVYRRVVGDWLRGRAADAPAPTSLSLGRAVDLPWVSRHIADAALRAPGWAAAVAKAGPGTRDRLARPAVLDPQLLARLAVPFAGSRVVVTGLSYEKVLFGPAARHSSDPAGGAVLVPFDAQLWLRLEVRGEGGPRPGE